MSKNVKQLIEDRASVKEDMRDIVRNAENENRDLTNEEWERFGKFDQDLEALTQQIEKRKRIEKILAEDAAKTQEKDAGVRTMSKEEEEKAYRQAYGKWMRYGMSYLDSEERALFGKRQTNMELRAGAQVTTDTALGGYLVPTELANTIDVRMQYYSGMLEACQVINTASGEQIEFPTLDDVSNVGELTSEEATAISVTDLSFGQKLLNAFTYDSDIVKVSVQLLQDSAFNLDTIIANAFGARLGRAVNTALTTGTGSDQPHGIVTALNTAGRTTAAAVGSAISRNDLLDLQHAVDRAYRVGPRVGYMFSDGTLKLIKKLSLGSGDARPLWVTSMRDGEPDTIEGFRYWVNNDVATVGSLTKSAIFGDFEHYIIRRAGGMVIVPMRERFMDELKVGYISYLRIDGECIQPYAFSLLVNPT